MLVNQTFLYKNGSLRYKYLLVNRDRTFFTNEETLVGKKYDEILSCQMIDFLIDIIYMKMIYFASVFVSPLVQTVPHFWLASFCIHTRLNF